MIKNWLLLSPNTAKSNADGFGGWVFKSSFLSSAVEVVMNEFKKDLMIGVISFTGIVGFISGEFILSTLMFGVAALMSNMTAEPAYPVKQSL